MTQMPFTPPTAEAQLVSVGYPSGIGWLMNVLLEMEVRTSWVSSDWPPPMWTPCEGGYGIIPPAYDVLQGMLPTLHREGAFTFQPGLDVLATHGLHVFARHPERPMILYVRDPRDAIYSRYRRDFADQMSLNEYLKRSAPYEHEGPDEISWLNMPPAETWAIFHLLCLALAECMNVLVVRFEDMKTDPLGETKRVLEFLGLERADAQIQNAINLSTFERTKAVLAETGQTSAYTGQGKTGGWRALFQSEDLACFAGLGDLAMGQFGYQQAQSETHAGVETLTFEAFLDTASPGVRPVLRRVESDLRGHNPDAARHRLVGALTGDLAAGDGAIVSALTALHWTRIIFPDEFIVTPVAQRAFGLFCSLNHQFRDVPHFQILQMEELAKWLPTLPAVFDRWGTALYNLHRPDDAEKVFKRACGGGADSALLRSNLAVLYWEAGDPQRATEQILQGALLDPNHPGIRQNLAAIEAALTRTN